MGTRMPTQTPSQYELSNQGVDNFEDDTPIELPNATPPAPTKTPAQKGGDDTKTEDEPAVRHDSFDDPINNDQKSMMDNKEDDDEEGEDKEDSEGSSKVEGRGKDNKGAEEEAEEDEETEAKTTETKEPLSGKNLKFKVGDETVEMNEEATVKTKVNGKNEFVSIKELKEDYSGRQAWGEKIEQANIKTKDAEAITQKTVAERNEIQGHFTEIANILDDPKKNPADALMYLVDMSGRNVLDFTKKLYSSMEEQLEELSDMDETERKLYWRDKEVVHLRNNQAAKDRRADDARADMERKGQLKNLRESRDVTEEQYNQASAEMTQLGVPEAQITPSSVVDYASLRPHLDTAEGLCEQFEDDLGDDDLNNLVTEVTKTLRDFPRLSKDKALQRSLENLGYDYETEDDDIDDLNSKVKTPSKPTGKVTNKTDGPESFDDFQDDYSGGGYQNSQF